MLTRRLYVDKPLLTSPFFARGTEQARHLSEQITIASYLFEEAAAN